MIRTVLFRSAMALTIGVGLIAGVAAAQPAAPTPAAISDTTVAVHLRGMTPGKGAAIVLLFDSEQGFESGKSVQSSKLDAAAAVGDVTFSGLTPGRYAVKAFYDINGNGAYDQGTDGLAFSNHVTMRDTNRVPTFSETSFMVKPGANTQQMTFAIVGN